MIDRAVIIAIGSTHHRSQLIYNRPRAMLPILGKPLVTRIMDRLVDAGIHRFHVVLGIEEGGLASYLNSHWLPHVDVKFLIHPTGQPITDALAQIVQQDKSPFILTSYNSFTHVHFPERLIKHSDDHSAALVLSGAHTPLSRSNTHYYAHMDADRVVNIEKHALESGDMLHLSDMALCGEQFIQYLHTAPKLDFAPDYRDLIHLYRSYLHTNAPVYLVDTAWTLQIETDPDLLTLSKHLLDEEEDAHILSELPGTVQIIPPVRIDPQVSVGQHARIGPYVYLESGCSIGQEATVSNALILQKSVVLPRERISDTILASKARISTR